MKAVECVVEDEGFNIQSPLAEKATKTAVEVLGWCSCTNNRLEIESFAKCIYSKLQVALTQPVSGRDPSKRREKMWRNYHVIRSSEDFVGLWIDFLAKSSGRPASPTFYQYVTDKLFRMMIKKEFSTETRREVEADVVEELSYEEDNALRYAAGYVYRAVRDRVLTRHKNDTDLLLSLEELLDDTSFPSILMAFPTVALNTYNRPSLMFLIISLVPRPPSILP